MADISLLITDPGRSSLLRKSLERLVALTLPAQLVVVDDESRESQAIAGEVRRFEDDTGVPSIYARNERSNGSPGLPRNLGLPYCSQPFVVFSDPECYFVSDVLFELGACSPDKVTLAGTVYYGEDDQDLARLDQLELSGGGTANAPYVAIVARQHLLEIGGWDERFEGWGGDDIDLLLRLEEIGVERAFCSEARVLHQFHGDGGGVEKKMEDAKKNSDYLYRKPYMHGKEAHVCSPECMVSRGVKVSRSPEFFGASVPPTG